MVSNRFKILTGLVMMLLVPFAPLLAQRDSSAPAPLEQILQLQPAGNQSGSLDQFNRAVILQSGTSNEVSIQQINSMKTGMNFLSLSQTGSLNSAWLQQDGSHITTALEQQGTGNSCDLDIKGLNLFTAVRQEGISNSFMQQVLGNAMSLQITQQGSNNSFLQIENGTAARHYIVTQSGDGIRTIIINGTVPGASSK